MPANTQPQPQQEQQPTQPSPERPAEETQEERKGGKVLHMHTAHPRVPIPYVTPGDAFRNARTATSTATSLLPSPRKLFLYGVLGGMAAGGFIAWPVAVAVGGATEVITREHASRQRAGHDQGQQDAAERTEPGRPAQAAAT
ncbi:hypothetical protein [Streptomyces djakartensis]|uniref:YtxH domain-containing protein n=1 Tax=Streptomyces djakartensis TaxID=68193 RepID=A0ABQ3A8F2_9ACTN|nr:hypothetical protein [Streptomyces djakartensis]GGY40989.1 hypothetical protein GCM10010384_54950 [Streptomyces djakartensis]